MSKEDSYSRPYQQTEGVKGIKIINQNKVETMASSKLKAKLKKRRESLESGGGGKYNFFIFKEGTHRMRALPVGEDEEFGCEVTTFFLGKDIGGIISPVSFGGKCAINDMYTKLSNSNDEDEKDLASKFKPKKKFMVPMIKYLDEKGLKIDTEAGPKLAQLTSGQYQDLLDLFLDDEQGDFTDARKGYDIKIKRVGSGQMNTEYSMLPCKPTKLDPAYAKKVFNPEEMVKKIMPTYEQTKEYIKQFMKGSVSSDDEGSSKKSKSSKKTSKDKSGVKKKKKKPF